jgi:hypothetical protein
MKTNYYLTLGITALNAFWASAAQAISFSFIPQNQEVEQGKPATVTFSELKIVSNPLCPKHLFLNSLRYCDL